MPISQQYELGEPGTVSWRAQRYLLAHVQIIQARRGAQGDGAVGRTGAITDPLDSSKAANRLVVPLHT
jgi:hypothetical protein